MDGQGLGAAVVAASHSDLPVFWENGLTAGRGDPAAAGASETQHNVRWVGALHRIAKRDKD
jgi:hypothetical protein